MKTKNILKANRFSKLTGLFLILLLPTLLSAQVTWVSPTGGATTVNVGDEVTYTVNLNGTTLSQYSWSGYTDGGALAPGTTITSTSITIKWNVASSTPYTLFYNYEPTNAGGQEFDIKRKITVSATTTILKPTLSIVSQPTCPDTDGTFTIANYSSYTNQHTFSATSSTGGIANIVGNTITAEPGTYTIKATLGSNSSAASDPRTVDPPIKPDVPVLEIVTQPSCSDPNVTFKIDNFLDYTSDHSFDISPSGATRDGATITGPAAAYIVRARTSTNSASARAVPASDCISDWSLELDYNPVIKNLTAGTISSTSQQICYDGDPANISGGTAPTSSHSMTYQWQFKEINTTNWVAIGSPSSSTSALSYNPPGSLKKTRTYRREVVSCGQTLRSNEVTVTVAPQLDAPTGTTAHSVCGTAEATLSLTADTDASEVRWYSSLTGGTYLGSGSISKGEGTYYASSYYSSNGLTCSSARTTVTVSPFNNLNAGTISSTPQQICYDGDPANILGGTAPSGGGTKTYQWQYKEINTTNWVAIGSSSSSTSALSYNPPGSLKKTRTYRRVVVSCGQTLTSNEVTVTVAPQLDAPTGTTAHSVCGTAEATLSLTADTDASEVRWYSSLTGGTYLGSGSISKGEGTYYASSYYSSNGLTCSSARTTVTVSPFNNLNAGTISSTPQQICYDGDPANIAGGTAPTSDYSMTYQWQYKEINTTNWVAIGSASSSTSALSYNPPGSLKKTRTYRRVVVSCGQTLTSNEVTVTVAPQLDAPTGTTAHSVCGSAEATLSLTADTDASEVRWYSSLTGGTYLGSGSISKGEGTYYASSYYSSNGLTCSSARTTVTVTLTGAIIWSLDADSDDFAVNRQESCSSPGTGWRALDLPLGDCDDTNANITIVKIWYADYDGDGLGNPNAPTELLCEAPANHVEDNTDQCPNKNSPNNDCFAIPSDCNPGGGAPSGQWSKNNFVYSRTYQNEVENIPTSKFASDNNYIQSITYFDGLGRPTQQNAIRQSPTAKDIVTHIEYDSFGRMSKEWLPVHEDQQAMGRFKTGDMATATKTYYRDNYGDDFQGMDLGEHNPYSEKNFEASPLNRITKQAAPGKDWKLGNDHEIEFDYQSNTSADGVKRFEVTLVFANNTYSPSIQTIPNYEAGELSKNVTKDENHTATSGKNHTTEEFTDKNGRVVLKRTYADIDANNDGDLDDAGDIAQAPHDTYYVYDDYGNLTYVLPPKTNGSIANMEELGYQYVYDYRNRLVEKQIPGKGREYIIYNKLDQPILTQDANQREKSTSSDEWLFTQYDAFGRVAYTGLAKTTNELSRTALQADVSGLDTQLWVNQTSSSTVKGATSKSTAVYYSDAGYPNANSAATLDEVLTVNYYDTYVDNAGVPQTFTPLGEAQEINGTSINTKGLPTVSKVKVLAIGEVNNWITSVSYYDVKGRPIYSYSQNDYLGTTDIMETELDFIGKPLKTRTTHQRGTVTIVTIDNFAYDHTGRLLAQTQCIGDATLGTSCGTGEVISTIEPIIEIDNETVTDERVASSSIKVTNATLSPGAHLYIGTDEIDNGYQELIVFNAYDNLGQLKYKKVGGTPDYNDFNNSAELQQVAYKYNVRGWLTDINDVANVTPDKLFNFSIGYNQGATPLFNGNISQTQWRTDNTDSSLKSYDYSYDALNRIKTGIDNTEHYNLNGITYDKNGNIQSLTRNGFQNGSDFTDMDVLDYDYDSGNKLLKVTDAGNDAYGFKDGTNTSNDFVYDANGNMVKDLNKGIVGVSDTNGITYNHLNLPTEVKVNNVAEIGTISYIYDATGVKLQKNVLINGVETPTDYAGNYIYENGVLQFFNTPEGYVEPNTTGGYDYIYQYKDHLGNIRLSYKNVGTATNVDLEIQEENNYYPFGLKHKGYNGMQSAARNHKYGFAGKEEQDELGLGWIDITARNYDASLGRWMNIDPLAEQYYSYSSYNYTLNSPIKFKDEDGNVVRDPDGNIIFSSSGSSFSTGAQLADKVVDASGNVTYTLVDRTYEEGNIYADNGTAVQALNLVSATQRTVKTDKNGKILTDTTSSVDTSKYDCSADCHGKTFGDDKIWINDDQVQTLLDNDNYINTGAEEIADIVVFKGGNGNIVHSGVRNSNGTYDDNAGFLKTEYGRTLGEASRGLTGGALDVANVGNRFTGNVNFFFKAFSDKVLQDKRVNNLGTEKNGVRKITDKKDIAAFLKILSGN